ncbi:MAG: hypothetical protein ABIS03_03700 [Gemmatimonadaceae bacterium]
MGRSGALLLLLIGPLAACVDIPTGSDEVLSLQIGPLPSPSVVVRDTLRDTLGVIQPIPFRAFNYSGNEIPGATARFNSLDRAIRVDSITGIVIADSVRATTRILARVQGITASFSIPVTLRPDTVTGSNARDSLAYSLIDTANVSNGIGIRVLHGLTTSDSSVASYLVSFRIVSPTDTLLARLVNERGTRSSLDTTDAGGIATRRIRLDVSRLTSLVDSVVVQATVKYRGVNVRGSPARLVLKVKPK